jgi:hypothetical protein
LSGSVETPFAFDLETELIAGPLHVPRPSLGMAYDGERLVLIHPTYLGEFVQTHKSVPVVFQNGKFDFWVMHKHFEWKDDSRSKRCLWDWVDADHWADTFILELLLRLARDEFKYGGVDLGRLVDRYTDLPQLAKDDPYRIRYGELLGMAEDQMEAHPEWADGFLAYALKDPVATREVYAAQRAEAIGHMDRVNVNGREFPKDALRKWGPLSLAIQVKASIALDHMSRTPIHIDREKRAAMEARCRERLTYLRDELTRRCPDLFDDKSKVKTVGGLPAKRVNSLRKKLEEVATDLGIDVLKSKGKNAFTSVSAKDWSAYSHDFLDLWVRYEVAAKELQFLMTVDSPDGKVWTRYTLLVRSGRTSASKWKQKSNEDDDAIASGKVLPGANLQQMPKDAEFRSLFVAPGGYQFYCSDYSYAELRTLAATCLYRFGKSKLAEAIRQHTEGGGLDPHEVMAATILGVTHDEYRALPSEKRKKYRQSSKAVGFGAPGGLGAKKLRDYAEFTYKVKMTEDEAAALRDKWKLAFPEMTRWLEDTSVRCLAVNFHIPEKDARAVWGDSTSYLLNVLTGRAYPKSDAVMSDAERERRTATADRTRDKFMKWVATLPKTDLRDWCLEHTFPDAVFGWKPLAYVSTTLTGRVRGGCAYTDAKNNSFQGLCADAGKLAIWSTMRKYGPDTVIGFVHDECLFRAKTAADGRNYEKCMNDAMARVLGTVPSATEGVLTPVWKKS